MVSFERSAVEICKQNALVRQVDRKGYEGQITLSFCPTTLAFVRCKSYDLLPNAGQTTVKPGFHYPS